MASYLNIFIKKCENSESNIKSCNNALCLSDKICLADIRGVYEQVGSAVDIVYILA